MLKGPMRSLADLRAAEGAGRLPEFVFFWGHRPRRAGDVGPWCLSQWWPSRLVVDGVAYVSAEQYMMAEKAALFGDEAARERILATADPRTAKQLGRHVSGFDETAWAQHRYDIVVRGNLGKFRQNPKLRAYLCDTAGSVLVEASPVDTVWGIGFDANDARAARPSQWRGENLLGFALMDVRATLLDE